MYPQTIIAQSYKITLQKMITVILKLHKAINYIVQTADTKKIGV